MSDPANRVQAFTVIGRDSLACEALTNPTEVAGKIAIVYRGTCEFGVKALNAQNAGAIGVVVVNNAPGAPIAMGAGASGDIVTIPTVMIGQADGAALHDQVVAGNVEMLIGSLQGMFPDNLSMSKTDALIPSAAAYPKLAIANAGEFSISLGSWVHNYGSAAKDNVTLSCNIMNGGSSVYSETSSPTSILAGDSTFIDLPVFAQDAYNGRYDITYSAAFGGTDQYPDDDTYTATFTADSLLSLTPIDPATNLPYMENFVKSAATTPPPVFSSCIQFKDAHASRLKAEGIWAGASVAAGGDITGIQVDARMYEWNDAVTGESDATFNNVSEIINGVFVYTSSDQSSTAQYIPFAEATTMVDNQRYLFCVSTSSSDVFLAYSTRVDYDENSLVTDQFANIMQLDSWGVGGWVDRSVPSLAVSMSDALVGIHENNVETLTPYPNPTSRSITIPMKGNSGAATLTVFDSKGAQVLLKEVNVTNDNLLKMDLQNLNAGTYLFNMDFANGSRSKFRVVVNK